MSLLLKVSPWTILMLSLVLGGLSIFLGNFVYPYVKDQQDLATKQVAVKALLSDEVLRNIRLFHRILMHLQKGSVNISPLEMTALDTVIASGAAQSLEPAFFKKLLNVSYTIKQAQGIHHHLAQIMLNPQGAAQRKALEEELKLYLVTSRALLIELFKTCGLESYLTYPDEMSSLKADLVKDGVQW